MPTPEHPTAEHLRTWGALALAVFLIAALVLGGQASRRGVDADEGFYMMAGANVLAGEHIYGDFFYPQMPYLPYLEAVAFAVTGPSLMGGRLVGVVTGALLAALLAVVAARWTHLGVGIAVAGLYIANSLVSVIVSTGKTYGPVNLALVGALLCLFVVQTRAQKETASGGGAAGIWYAFGAGVCAGFAIGTRLPALGIVPVLALWALILGWRYCLALGAGVFVASLPWLLIAAHDPQNFWFCNVEFHSARREITGLWPVMRQKIMVLSKWVVTPQHLILWGVAAAGVVIQPRTVLPIAGCALSFAGGYLLATPTYLQYLTQVIPFLVLAAVPAIAALWPRRPLCLALAALYLTGFIYAQRSVTGVDTAAQFFLTQVVPFLLVAASLCAVAWAVRWRVAWGGAVLYIAALAWTLPLEPEDAMRKAKRSLWYIDTVEAVTAHIQAHSDPEDPILSWWEGYPVIAQRPGFTGVGFWESNAAKKLAPADRVRYHVRDQEDVRQLVVTRKPRLIVFPDGTWRALVNDIQMHYEPIGTFGLIRIFQRREHHNT